MESGDLHAEVPHSIRWTKPSKAFLSLILYHLKARKTSGYVMKRKPYETYLEMGTRTRNLERKCFVVGAK